MIGAVLDWLETHPGLASWAQAIGTVTAIVVALLLPRWDRSQLEKTTAMSLRLPLRHAWFALAGAHQYAHRDQANTPARDKTLRELRASVDRLTHVPLHSLSLKCADATNFIKDQLSAMAELLEDNAAGDAHTREEADFLKGEVEQAFRDLYRAASIATDVEIATHIRK